MREGWKRESRDEEEMGYEQDGGMEQDGEGDGRDRWRREGKRC